MRLAASPVRLETTARPAAMYSKNLFGRDWRAPLEYAASPM
jgi:hypothetical protein